VRERELIATLNRLIETCCDGSQGYEAAAETVSDLKLRRLLARLALERRGFEDELGEAVVRLGGRPIHHGTVRGALHRGWIQVTGSGVASAYDVLRQCAFGEKVSLEHYAAALRKDLPEDLRSLVSRHLGRVAEARALIVDLEQSQI
jgi:uncharacterized protein (TIGR02284 family)